MATQPPIIGAFTDSRDGQVYKTVKLKDDNTWMAQNFNFDAGEGCFFYENDAGKGSIYGRMYTWDAATRACPRGWRLPTQDEVIRLENLYGGHSSSYNALIKDGISGFNALLGGTKVGGDHGFYDLGKTGYYALGSNKDLLYAFDAINAWMGINHRGINTNAISCRYIKE